MNNYTMTLNTHIAYAKIPKKKKQNKTEVTF